MHGYVLRKRLHETLGMFRTFSYGSLYPTLRRLQRAGLIAEEPEEVSPAEQAEPTATRASAGRSGSRQTNRNGWGRKARRVYKQIGRASCRGRGQLQG